MIFGYIYIIKNTVNDKVYIGKTRRDIDRRYSQHLTDARNCRDKSLIHKAMRKYGFDKFSVELLDSADSSNELNSKERMYIKKYNSKNPNFGYNLTDGGDGGCSYIIDSETREKISKANSNRIVVNDGKTQRRIKQDELTDYLNKGYVLGCLPFTRTEENKLKIAEANKNLVCINNGTINTRVKKELLPQYLSNGYCLGWLKRVLPRNIHITNDIESKNVNEDELQYYINIGWHIGNKKYKRSVQPCGYKLSEQARINLSIAHKGNKQSSEAIKKQADKLRGRVAIHNSKDEVKLIYKKDLNQYLSAGWIQGRPKRKNIEKVLN